MSKIFRYWPERNNYFD